MNSACAVHEALATQDLAPQGTASCMSVFVAMLQAWPWRCLRPAKRLHQRTGAYPESLQGSIPSGHLLSECRVEQRRGAGAPKAEANIRQEASQDFKNFKATVQGTRPRPAVRLHCKRPSKCCSHFGVEIVLGPPSCTHSGFLPTGQIPPCFGFWELSKLRNLLWEWLSVGIHGLHRFFRIAVYRIALWSRGPAVAEPECAHACAVLGLTLRGLS